jgi:predicted small secreted protein
MKRFTLIVLAAATLLSGCATTRQGQDTAQAPASAASAPAQKPVPVPAASARKVVLNMSGAKASVEAKDWADFKREWSDTFEEHAKEAGISFAMQEGEPRPLGETGTLLAVHVNDYRMVGIGSRIFFGVMTGNAYVDAKIRFADLNTGKSFGEQNYNTSSSAWHGIFAKMTPQQVDSIAAEVFRELKNAR